MHSPPALIVTSPAAGPRLWAEVLNLGGYDVLAQPFSTEEVLWSVQQAHSADASTWIGHNQEHPEELPSAARIGLPENSQRCALLGNERFVTGDKPHVSHTNRRGVAPRGWTGACSIRNGSQRSTLKR